MAHQPLLSSIQMWTVVGQHIFLSLTKLVNHIKRVLFDFNIISVYLLDFFCSGIQFNLL